MKNLKVLLLLIITTAVYGQQQEPVMTQYMYNMSSFNPAYAFGYPGKFKAGMLYNKQWLGIDGSPSTTSIFAQSSITESIEGGLNIIYDEIGKGLVTNTIANIDLKYSIPILKDLKASLGVKYGVRVYNVQPTTEGDFAIDKLSLLTNQLGFGMMVYSDNFYAGMSTSDVILEKSKGFQEIFNSYFNAGYIYKFNKQLFFKLAGLATISDSDIRTVDLNFMTRFSSNIEAGLGYRLGTLVSGMINFRLYKSIRFTYSYGHILNNLSNYGYGTHEIGLLLDVFSWKQLNRRFF